MTSAETRIVAESAARPWVADSHTPRRLDDEDLIARMRAMSIGERLESGFELCEFAAELVGAARP